MHVPDSVLKMWILSDLFYYALSGSEISLDPDPKILPRNIWNDFFLGTSTYSLRYENTTLAPTLVTVRFE
jgi:hypothetical protein